MANNPTNQLRVYRGDIVRVDFEPIEGSEQGGIRPALVLSPEITNRGDVIVVAPITSQKTERVFAWEALIEAGEGGLQFRSKAMFRNVSPRSRRFDFAGHGRLRHRFSRNLGTHRKTTPTRRRT